jgi:hypothetical protein
MGAAISIFVLLSVSIFVVRLAAVAMRLTGLDDSSASFQALSAFTGTGFTTQEAEMIVNYPVRRRIVSLLMIVGNLGLVGVFATLVASLVQTDGEVEAVIRQLGWILGGLVLIWFLMLNKTADRVICGAISKLLIATTRLGHRKYHRLLQIGDRLSVCEHRLDSAIDVEKLDSLGLRPMAVRDNNGKVRLVRQALVCLDDGGWLIAYGDDSAHDAFAERAG